LRGQDKDTNKADCGKRPTAIFASFQQHGRLLVMQEGRQQAKRRLEGV